MKLILRLYVEGKRTDKTVDFDRVSDYRSSLDEWEIDPRPEWAEINGVKNENENLLKFNPEEVRHEWKIESESERGDLIPAGWGYGD